MTVSILSVRARAGGAEAEIHMEIAERENVQHIKGTVLAALFSETGLPWEVPAPFSIEKETCDRILFYIEETAAIQKGLVFLDYAGCTVRRLVQKLAGKGFSREAAQAAAEYLAAHGYINEKRDAQMLCETLAKRKRYGKARIRRELFSKGFGEDVIRGAIEELDVDFSEICAQRLEDMGGLSSLADRNAKQKAIAALMRNGFSYDEIREAVRRLSSER